MLGSGKEGKCTEGGGRSFKRENTRYSAVTIFLLDERRRSQPSWVESGDIGEGVLTERTKVHHVNIMSEEWISIAVAETMAAACEKWKASTTFAEAEALVLFQPSTLPVICISQ